MAKLLSFEHASEQCLYMSDPSMDPLERFAHYVTSPIDAYFTDVPDTRYFLQERLPAPKKWQTQILPDFEPRAIAAAPSNFPASLLPLFSNERVVCLQAQTTGMARYKFKAPDTVWVFLHSNRTLYLLPRYMPLKRFAELYWYPLTPDTPESNNMRTRALDELIDMVFFCTSGSRHGPVLKWRGTRITDGDVHASFMIAVGRAMDSHLG